MDETVVTTAAELCLGTYTLGSSPISRLPRDVFHKIMLLCYEEFLYQYDKRGATGFAPRVALVSRIWHAVIIEIPKLWSTVYIQTDRMISLYALHTYLERSGLCPLDITIDGTEIFHHEAHLVVQPAVIIGIMQVLDRHIYRWASLDINVPVTPYLWAALRLWSDDAVSLRWLTINVNVCDEVNVFFTLDTLGTPQASSLAVLHLDEETCLRFQHFFRCLPSVIMVTMSRLIGRQLETPLVLDALSNLRYLQCLMLCDLSMTVDDIPYFNRNVFRYDLNALTDITFHNIDASVIRDFFARTRMPNLRRMTLLDYFPTEDMDLTWLIISKSGRFPSLHTLQLGNPFGLDVAQSEGRTITIAERLISADFCNHLILNGQLFEDVLFALSDGHEVEKGIIGDFTYYWFCPHLESLTINCSLGTMDVEALVAWIQLIVQNRYLSSIEHDVHLKTLVPPVVLQKLDVTLPFSLPPDKREWLERCVPEFSWNQQ